jgi:AcrR family transcriptional regulator
MPNKSKREGKIAVPAESLPELPVQALTPQQRGAMITNSGKSPIASLPSEERKQLLDYVMQRAYQDMRLKDVAEELGVSRTGLNQALLKYCQDDWQDMQVARALVTLEDAEQDLETADAMHAVSRAGHRLRSAQWQLEKLSRRLFGQEQTNTAGQGTININIGITRSPPQVSHVIDSVEVVPVDLTGKGEGGEG